MIAMRKKKEAFKKHKILHPHHTETRENGGAVTSQNSAA